MLVKMGTFPKVRGENKTCFHPDNSPTVPFCSFFFGPGEFLVPKKPTHRVFRVHSPDDSPHARSTAIASAPGNSSINYCTCHERATLGNKTFTPSKFNIDTKNDGLENVSPFKHGVILGIYVSFQGCIASHYAGWLPPPEYQQDDRWKIHHE